MTGFFIKKPLAAKAQTARDSEGVIRSKHKRPIDYG